MLTRFILIISIAFLTAIPVNAQSSSVDSLMKFAGNIHQFNSIFPQEKVYIQFDNTSYYTGETIWFKAFVVNASNLQRAQSKVLYVDLISPSGVLLKQQKLKIVAGQADGSFPLLDGSTAQAREKRGVMSYPSGFYEVRAYTSFMQNFSEASIFSRVFAVYEKPKEEGNYYAENPTILLRKSETSEFRPKTENLRKINCTFYPEGGHIIAGKPCRVAFKVTDDSGLGIDATGVLENSGITFSTVHDGMGWFTFTPQDRRNQVEITVGNNSRTFSLPQTEQSGCALSVNPCGTDSIILNIDYTPQLQGTTLGMTMTCRGELVEFLTFETGSEPIEKAISMRGIPEGVCRINIFDKDGNIYASRSIYHHNQEIKTPVLEVTSDKEQYNPFEKVLLRFNLKDGQGNPFRDRFCLSVRDIRGQGNVLADDLRTSLLLSSDLKGLIENPSWYFDSDDPERDEALDLLMLVQGWERYDWQTMTGQKEFRERHRLEQSLTLNGWVLNSSGKKPVGDIEVLAALMPQDKTQSETYTYRTDSSGYFGFDIGSDFYDKARFTIDAHVTKQRLLGTSARIKLDRSMIPAVRAYKPQELVFSSLQSGSKSSKNKNQTEEKADDLPTVISASTGLLLPDVDIEEERMYIDYFTFNAYDVVKDVEIDLDKGDYSTDLMGYLLDKGYEVIPDDSGGIEAINGFAPFFYVHDSKKYQNQGVFENPSSIDSKDIKSIIVFDRPMYLMNILTQCPLYQQYLTKTMVDLTGSETLYQRMLLVDILVKEGRELSTRDEIYKINKRITTVDGYSRPYSFYSPEYPNGPVLGDVDFRRTLYWNPNVITDSIGNAQVEFYNSSITKHFNIEAAGITSSGVPYILDAGF
ncbi:MAG: hypothetical protein IK039_04995 [Bacteroidaceae bacterium]|nr:hypothetical protein [Bacteroidaceae bacterium]